MKSWRVVATVWLVVLLMLTSFEIPAQAQVLVSPTTCDWTGTWTSSYGELRLVQVGTAVAGDYGTTGVIRGATDTTCTLTGSFSNEVLNRSGTFTFNRTGKAFSGTWAFDGTPSTSGWTGVLQSTDRPTLQKASPPAQTLPFRTVDKFIDTSSLGTVESFTYVPSPKIQPWEIPLSTGVDSRFAPPIRSVLGCESDLISIGNRSAGFIGLKLPGVRELYLEVKDRVENRGEQVRAIAIAPDCNGGSVITDKSAFTRNIGKGTGPGYYDTLNRLRSEGKAITAIAFDPYQWSTRKAWVIAYDGGFEASPDTALDLKNSLGEAIRNGETVTAIAFRPRQNQPSGWAILGNQGYTSTRNVSGENPTYYDVLRAMNAKELQPHYVSFRPDQAGAQLAYAVGTQTCEATNTFTQRVSETCELNLLAWSYQRRDSWYYEQNWVANCTPGINCARHATKAGLMDTPWTPVPTDWFTGGESIEVNFCKKGAIVDPKITTITIRDPKDRPISRGQMSIVDCQIRFAPVRETIPSSKTIVNWPPHAHSRLLEGDYAIDITASGKVASEAKSSLTGRYVVPVRDVWVAIIGDSYASGEGAALFDVRDPAHEAAHWLYEKRDRTYRPENLGCNVSPVAWGAVAADYIAERMPHYGVKVSNFACSGATLGKDAVVEKTVSGNYKIAGEGAGKLYAQMPVLEKAIQGLGRKPDFLFFTAGGNDANFANIIQECIAFGCSRFGPNDKAEFDKAAAGLASLPGRYQKLNQHFSDLEINPERIFTPAYFDPTQGDSGKIEVCMTKEWGIQNCPSSKIPLSLIGQTLIGGVDASDWANANAKVAVPLRRIHEQAAKDYRWNYVKSAKTVFDKHGNCASQPYTNRMCEAIRRTGDSNGAYHPNKEGHQAVGIELGKAVLSRYGSLDFFK